VVFEISTEKQKKSQENGALKFWNSPCRKSSRISLHYFPLFIYSRNWPAR